MGKTNIYLTLLLVGLLTFTGCSSIISEDSIENQEKIDKFEDQNINEIKELFLEIKDCETNLSCFILASQNCENAIVNHIIETNAFGIYQKSNFSYEIKTINDSTCSFGIIVNEMILDYSQEMINMMKEQGMTNEEIKYQLETINLEYDNLIGRKGICEGESSIITSLLERWQRGAFATSDWNNLNCSGSYFNLN